MRAALYTRMKKCATIFLADVAVIPAEDFGIVREPSNNPMPAEPENALADYVRRVMQENGLSAEAVSKLAKRRGGSLPRSTVQQIVLGGTPNPGVHTLKLLAWGLSRPVEEVIAVALGTPSVQSSDFANLEELYRQLTLPDQRGVKRYWLQVMEREMLRLLKQQAETDRSSSGK